MNQTLDLLRRIAEVEYSDLVLDSQPMGAKLRLFIVDGSYVDIWHALKVTERFGFHWERQHIDGTLYRYDSFPDPAWRSVATYPRHFHNGSQDSVEAAPFAADVVPGFREFMTFVRSRISDSAEGDQ